MTLSIASRAAVKIDRVEPANWYVGMRVPKLQIMVHGDGIAQSTVTTDYPGVRIDSIVHLDSPNYLFLYLDIAGAQPGTMTLTFRQGRQTKRIDYPLLERAMSGDARQGFTSADALYLLMPDRFASGDKKNDQLPGMNAYRVDRSEPSLRHGGDLEGIRQHLDYFTRLGVTALWFTPVLENNSADNGPNSTYHGYATTDYYRVDPRFGSNDEYRRLIAEAHEHGLKVVMDMIFNHCGFDHPWLSDLPSHDWLNTPEWLAEREKGTGRDANTGLADGSAAGDSKYLQTSYKLTPVVDPYASEVDRKETVEGWFVPSMPDLNQRNPHLMTYLIQSSIWWIEWAGIDGIRMDTYPYADRDAMAGWMKRIDTEYPNFNSVGETWVTEPAYTAAWQKGSRLSPHNSYLKTVMDFSFFDKLAQAKQEETDGWWQGLNRIYNSLCYDYLYANPANVLAFIENHDTDRFLGDGCDTLALKQALALLLTINRTPQLYYGTEVLMNGTKSVTDGNVRRDFPGGFEGDTQNAFTGDGLSKAQRQMFVWTSRLLHWRQGNDVIAKGRQTQFIPWKGVYVIARQHEGRTVLTVLNGTSHAATLEVERYREVIGQTTEARNVLTGRAIDLSHDVRLTPRQSLVLEF